MIYFALAWFLFIEVFLSLVILWNPEDFKVEVSSDLSKTQTFFTKAHIYIVGILFLGVILTLGATALTYLIILFFHLILQGIHACFN